MTVHGKEDDHFIEAFRVALAGLDPLAMRVVGLAMSRAADLQSAGRGDDADDLLLDLLGILQERSEFGDLRLESFGLPV